jgi:hypothetical protein
MILRGRPGLRIARAAWLRRASHRQSLYLRCGDQPPQLAKRCDGDYVLAAPRAGGTVVGIDIMAGTSVGGNPFVRQRNVVPAEFT